jgi:hypothetical protein
MVDTSLINFVLNFNLLGSSIWIVLGLFSLAKNLKDRSGYGLQSAIWQIIGGILMITIAYLFVDISKDPLFLDNLMIKFGVITRIGGTLWVVWGIIVLAGALKDQNGPALQAAIWQIIGGGIIMVASFMFAHLNLNPGLAVIDDAHIQTASMLPDIKVSNPFDKIPDIIITVVRIGGALWIIWGIIVLAGALKDQMGPSLQAGIWQIVGGMLIMVATFISFDAPTPSPTPTVTPMSTEEYAYDIVNHIYANYQFTDRDLLESEIRQVAGTWQGVMQAIIGYPGVNIRDHVPDLVSVTMEQITNFPSDMIVPDDLRDYIVEEANKLADSI